MTNDDIIRMSQKIAAQCSRQGRPSTWTHDYAMQQIMALIEAEREQCAKVCEAYDCADPLNVSGECADLIRLRGGA